MKNTTLSHERRSIVCMFQARLALLESVNPLLLPLKPNHDRVPGGGSEGPHECIRIRDFWGGAK